jgi:hypothetical protein
LCRNFFRVEEKSGRAKPMRPTEKRLGYAPPRGSPFERGEALKRLQGDVFQVFAKLDGGRLSSALRLQQLENNGMSLSKRYDVSPQRGDDAKSSPPWIRRGCCGRRPWRGWWATRGIQPPRAGRCHVKASQAFTPSSSKEGTFLSTPFTYGALYRSIVENSHGLLTSVGRRPEPNSDQTGDIKVGN